MSMWKILQKTIEDCRFIRQRVAVRCVKTHQQHTTLPGMTGEITSQVNRLAVSQLMHFRSLRVCNRPLSIPASQLTSGHAILQPTATENLTQNSTFLKMKVARHCLMKTWDLVLQTTLIGAVDQTYRHTNLYSRQRELQRQRRTLTP